MEDTDEVDPDLYLLTGDDGLACIARADRQVSERVTPGRYVVIVDTWTNNAGLSLAGAYTLRMDLDAE